MAGLFLSSPPPPPPPSSPHTPPPPPHQPLPKSEVSFFNLCFFFVFFFPSCLSPFEFQRKPTTLKYQTGKEKGWWGGFSCSPPLCPHYPAVPLHLLRRSLRSGFGLWCFFLYFLFFFCIFTHLLRFSGGKVGLNPDFFEAREMILLWRIGPLKTSLNSSWCCKVTENLLRAGGPQYDASGLGTNWLCRLEDLETSREGERSTEETLLGAFESPLWRILWLTHMTRQLRGGFWVCGMRKRTDGGRGGGHSVSGRVQI